MGRYRSNNTDSVEQEIHKNISQAERYLKRALSSLHSVRGNSSIRKARYHQMENLLQTTLSALSRPPKMVASYDTSDPDLNPSVREEQRKKRAEERKARKERGK